MAILPELKFLVQRLLFSDFSCTLFITVCFIKKIGIANVLLVIELWDRAGTVEAKLHTRIDVKFGCDSPNGAKFVSEEIAVFSEYSFEYIGRRIEHSNLPPIQPQPIPTE